MLAKEPAIRLRASCLVLCLLALYALPSLCAAQAPAVWKPDPKLISQLGPEVTVEGYKICPPKEFGPFFYATGSTYRMVNHYEWMSLVPGEGQMPMLSITVIPATQCWNISAPPISYLHAAVKEVEKVERTSEPDVIFTFVQYGAINNILFVRVYWKGHTKDGTAMQGVRYTGVTSNGAYDITLQVPSPTGDDILPVMEAAALTFRKG